MAELLLAFACLNGSGCAETASQYRIYNPTLITAIETKSDKLAKAILANYWGPVIAYSAGRTGTLKLTPSIGLKLSQHDTLVQFELQF